MDSEYFFNNFRDLRIPGLYIIEQPLFRYKGKEVYKVGYARDSLYKRVRDYKTAYGIIPFKIHLLWGVPSGIVGSRALLTLLTETLIHKSLRNELVMVDEEGEMAGEWFFDLPKIIITFNYLKEKYKEKYGNDKVSSWFWFVNNKYENLGVRKETRSLKTDEANVNSRVKGVNVRDGISGRTRNFERSEKKN
jgi:hypothetical protein